MSSNKKYPWHVMFFGILLIFVFFFIIQAILSAVASIFGESHSIYKFLEGDVEQALSVQRWETRGSIVFVISALIGGYLTKLYLKKFPYKPKPKSAIHKPLSPAMLVLIVGFITLLLVGGLWFAISNATY